MSGVARSQKCSALVGLALIAACSKEPIELGTTNYGERAGPTCAVGERLGEGGIHDDEQTAGRIRYSVRTPANYDPVVAHPLLVVYAGAGHSRGASERFTDLTSISTTAGFIVAYADHRRLSTKVLDDLATIPAAIAQNWCINLEKVFLTGHSDGGTAAAAMAFRPDDGLDPAGIAPSAAGVSGQDLLTYQCPGNLRVMILHNRYDELFLGFGATAAQWWANCNRCETSMKVKGADGCLDYSRCPENGKVRYCEANEGHRRWPGINRAMLEFFL